MPKSLASASIILGLLTTAVMFAGPGRAADIDKGLEIAVFAGGCFWCVESDFDGVPGVVKTVSGFTGGVTPNPTYKQVVSKNTGHREVVQITYDPKKVTYAHLVDILFHSVDPTDKGGQFCDRGASYTTAIYATTPAQKQIAEKIKMELQDSGTLKAPIVTPIKDAGPFFPAEDYHQNFYTKSPIRYKFYRFNCGRDSRIGSLWGADAHKGIAKH